MRFLVLATAVFLATGCAGSRLHEGRRELYVADDIVYREGSTDPKHRLDLYAPPRGLHHPVVLFIHGGFWKGQDRKYLPGITGIYGNVGVQLARRGFVTAIPSYRLSPGVGIETQIDDVLAALRWLEENAFRYGGDPTRVVLGGYSAGGHLATLIAFQHRLPNVRGVFSISGILDVHEMAVGQDAAFNEELTWRHFGKTAEEQARFSPSAFVRPDAPPLLALAAEHDYAFVRTSGREVADKLTALGARASFEELPGRDHSDMILEINSSHDAITERVAKFADDVTNAASAAPTRERRSVP